MDLGGRLTGVDVPPPPLGTPPDPPTAAIQLSQTSNSVTARVTLPAVAPEYIRVTAGGVAGLRIFDVAVTEAGGDDQDIVIDGLYPDSTYTFNFESVTDGLTSETGVGFIGYTEASDGILDAPTVTGVTYNSGDQSFMITVTAGANNPSDTWYDCYYEDNPSSGVFQDVAASVQYTTLVSDFPQVVGASRQRYFKVKARALGWTTSSFSNNVLGTAPAAGG
jgi:hypothetical protein